MYKIVCYVFRCIDGYSRKIIWLRASYSNHKPGLIASYFLEAVNQLGGYPQCVRTDCGTENILVASVQSFVAGTTQSHIYGTSPHNQRIEAWWSFLRRLSSQYWIEVLDSLSESGAYNNNNIKQTDCLRFCIMNLIQQDLDEVRRYWNTHRIRPSVGARCPAGIPDRLYYLPHPPATDCMLRRQDPLPPDVLLEIEQPRVCENEEIEAYFQYLCEFNAWSVPRNAEDGLKLYFQLLPFL